MLTVPLIPQLSLLYQKKYLGGAEFHFEIDQDDVQIDLQETHPIQSNDAAIISTVRERWCYLHALEELSDEPNAEGVVEWAAHAYSG